MGKSNYIEKLILALIIASFSCVSVQAIEEVSPDNIPRTKKHKLFSHKIKKNTENDAQNAVEPTLLSPNESPGNMTDINKAKKYYDSLKENQRAGSENKEDKSEIIDPDAIKLPLRIHKDDATVHIEKVEISKSYFFSDEEIQKFKSLVEGNDVTAEDLNNLIALINARYKAKKVLTARASLVEGSLSGGVLKIELMEAKIGKIYIEGNKFNRKWFLKRMITRREGEILDLASLENDLKTFNKNARSIKLTAKLKPGERYGTTDVIVQAEEKIPYHFSASYDSFGRETTGLLRGGLMAAADSMFGFQDRLTGAVNLARSSTSPFVDYNVPVNKKGTRVGASYIYGDNKVTSGEYKDFDLKANTHVFSLYASHPIKDTNKFSLNLNTSANIKLSSASISDFTYSDYKDYNLAVGLGGRYNFNRSVLFGSLYSTNGIIKDSIEAHTAYFTKVNADAYYVHYLPKGIIATVKAGGQYTPQDVPYVEQFQIGGISSVRGYAESLLLSQNSYFASLELLFPIPFLPEEINVPLQKERNPYRLRDSVKFALFADHGAVLPKEGKIGTTNFLASVGAGIRIAISKYITARVYVGMPLMNTGVYNQSNARLHFDLVVSPF